MRKSLFGATSTLASSPAAAGPSVAIESFMWL
jgi:hypothetical protein